MMQPYRMITINHFFFVSQFSVLVWFTTQRIDIFQEIFRSQLIIRSGNYFLDLNFSRALFFFVEGSVALLTINKELVTGIPVFLS